MASRADIDRLIELGLNRYGQGDLDGALLVWEQVLAIDPDNPQATSYVDYVRLNYELLTTSGPELADDEGYGIEEEPEYQIEIQIPPADAPMYMDPLDEGWYMSSETDEPPPSRPSSENDIRLPDDNFEDATREYRGPASDFATESATSEFHHPEVTGNFQPEGTPVGFAQQETGVKKRDLGFVQPTAVPAAVKDKPSSPLTIGTAPTRELGAELEAPARKSTTRDLPPPQRGPARRDSESLSQAEVMLTHAPTQDFESGRRIDLTAPTRDLGLRPSRTDQDAEPAVPARQGRAPSHIDEDAPTGEADVRAIREAAARKEGSAKASEEGTKHDIVLPFDPIDARSAQILHEVDEQAPAFEPKEEQTRRRITMLLQRAVEYNANHETDKAVAAVDLALSEDPNSALGQKLITRNKDVIMQIFQSFIGDLERTPQLAKPLHELQNAPISPRAAFLLSRIDGTLTIDELLDVSGMPRLEAYRHLCQLMLRGILR